MTSLPLRRDAARNWQRIVDVGRRCVDQGAPIQLNDVAKEAAVGVATVYRHFPTAEALLETVATPGLEALVAQAERALAETDHWTAFQNFLGAAVHAQITDASIAAVLTTREDARPATTLLKQRLNELFEQLLAHVHRVGAVDPTMTPADLAPLMCGVTFAARARPADSTEERAETAGRYLSILLRGIHRP